ncbi:MAG: hypothetical protein E7260_04010 [Lachnospiraceae bacterium]|nr:hypothetical protein [Lachnospiraceae bacterium]
MKKLYVLLLICCIFVFTIACGKNQENPTTKYSDEELEIIKMASLYYDYISTVGEKNVVECTFVSSNGDKITLSEIATVIEANPWLSELDYTTLKPVMDGDSWDYYIEE